MVGITGGSFIPGGGGGVGGGRGSGGGGGLTTLAGSSTSGGVKASLVFVYLMVYVSVLRLM